MTDTVSETEISFEVWQDGDMVAAADNLSDAQHFMLVYGQDGPVEAKTAITTRFPGFNVVTAMLAASPQGEGSSADPAPIKTSADTGELRERVVSVVKNAVRDFEDDMNEDWKTAMTNAAGKAADAILDLIQSERGSPIGQNDQPGLAFSDAGDQV